MEVAAAFWASREARRGYVNAVAAAIGRQAVADPDCAHAMAAVVQVEEFGLSLACGTVPQLTVDAAAEYCLSPWVIDTPLERVFPCEGEAVARREGALAPSVADICGQWGRRRLLGRISRGLDAMVVVRLWS